MANSSLRIIEMEEASAQVVLEDGIPALANAIRRTMVADLPKMAIDEVHFHLGETGSTPDGKVTESVGPLFDEVVAHRLSMLPVPTDLDLFVPTSECDCEGQGCPNCILMFSMDVVGEPGGRMVTSRDLRPVADPSMAIKDPDIPITKLFEGQSLLLYANARLGTSREHAKFQGVHGAGYRYWPKLAADDSVEIGDLAGTTIKRCELDNCPGLEFELEGGELVLSEASALTLCGACASGLPDGVSFSVNDVKRYIINFETDGSLSARDVLSHSLGILADRFKEFEKKLDRLEFEED